MGARFTVESLEIVTATARRELRFKAGINVVEGPIGTGKSSMLELIKYGLGGSARVMPAVRDNVQRVVLHVNVGGDRLELSRKLGAHDIDVNDLRTGERLQSW